MHSIDAISEFVTNFGDLAVVLPLTMVICLWLVAVRGPRTGLWWLAAVGLCAGGTAFLKIYFYACPPLPDLRSPSGHTALSTLVYGALSAAVVLELRGWQRWLAAVIGALLALAIGTSRIIIHAHSIPEVLLGLLLGLATLALFLRAYPHSRTRPASIGWLVVSSIALIVLLDGHELRAEDFLHAISIHFHIASFCR